MIGYLVLSMGMSLRSKFRTVYANWVRQQLIRLLRVDFIIGHASSLSSCGRFSIVSGYSSILSCRAMRLQTSSAGALGVIGYLVLSMGMSNKGNSSAYHQVVSSVTVDQFVS